MYGFTQMTGGIIMKCINCSVTVISRHNRCPLCGALVNPGETDHSHDNEFYPEYPEYKESKLDKAKRAGFFITIAFSAIAVFVNLFSLTIHESFWSFIVVSCLFYAFISLKTVSSKKIHTGAKFLFQLIMLSFLAVIIDVFSGFTMWSTTYVIPSLSTASSFVITVFAASKKALYKEYLGYILTSLLISIVPAVLCIFSLSERAWVGYAALLFSLIMLFGLYIFADKDFKRELKKRFHL